MPSLVRIVDITNTNAIGVDFPSANGFIEETLAGSQFASIRVNEKGIVISVTDMLLSSAGVGGLEPYAYELGKALANAIDTDILRDISHLINSTGKHDKTLTEATFLDAICKLEEGNVSGPYVCVLHPKQVSDLKNSIVVTSGAIWGGPSVQGSDLGAFASLYGVDMFKSVNCPTINAGADRQGVMMPMGNRSGLGYVLKTSGNSSLERDVDLRATEVFVSTIYGHGCVDSKITGGVAIVSKA